MLRLISYMSVPHENYWFTETINGHKHTAAQSPIITQIAFEVMTWRKGNDYPRKTFGESLADVDAFTCARAPRYCFETTHTVESLHAAIVAGGCRGCGARVS